MFIPGWVSLEQTPDRVQKLYCMKVVLYNCSVGKRGTRVTLEDLVEYNSAVELRTNNIAGLNAFKDKDHHCTRGPLPILALGPLGDQSRRRAFVCYGHMSAGA